MNVFSTPDYEIVGHRVIDGDTIAVEVRKTVTIRLSRINCPEKKDHLKWNEAKTYVTNKLENCKQFKVVSVKQGNFGRYLAEVFVDGENLNNELLERGHAIKYKRK